MQARATFALLVAAAAAAAAFGGRDDRYRVRRVLADGTLVVDGVGKVRLQGVDVPAPRRRAFIERLRALVRDVELEVRIDGADPGRTRVKLGVLRRPGAMRSVNELLLGEGLAFYRVRTKDCSDRADLMAAARRARDAGAGVWRGTVRRSGPLPRQRGAALGLYYKVEEADYHEQIDRIRKAGADWLALLLTAFVDEVDSNEVELDRRRTVSDARLRETVAYARAKGLRVALVPVVLIRDAASDDWRGTLRPTDPGRFWRSYDDFLCRYLDIARETGVELFYVGSELCSLEKHREVWPKLIQNARGRYGGWLSYSVNWDHHDVPRFWHLLDQVGMTAYFELTSDKDATPAMLEAAWRRLRGELATVSKRLGRPIVLTELGYPSQNGANTAPWNYYLAQDDIDLEEQADCWRAFAKVMTGAPFLHGVYVFDFFEQGGPKDHTYAVWGKPAWEVVTEFLRDFGAR